MKVTRIGRLPGLLLVGLAFLVTVMLYFITVTDQPVLPILYAVPGFLFLLGAVMIFSDRFERWLEIEDDLEGWRANVEDDLAALRQGKLTRGTLMMIIAAFLGFIIIDQFVVHKKWDALWGPVPVIFVAFVVFVVAVYFVSRLYWFHYRDSRTGWRFFIAPILGLLISMGAGIYFQEPVELGGPTAATVDGSGVTTPSISPHYYGTRGSTIFVFPNSSSGGSTSVGSIMPKNCTGSCAKGMAWLLLLALILVCIFASAFIVHFWVVAASLLFAIVAMVAIRELLYQERQRAAYM